MVDMVVDDMICTNVITKELCAQESLSLTNSFKFPHAPFSDFQTTNPLRKRAISHQVFLIVR